MGSRSRVFAAMALVAMPVSSGLYAAPSFAAEAVAAKGGCWAYVPNYTDITEETPLEERLAAPPARDGHSLDLTAPAVGALAWSPSAQGATLLLESSGGTALTTERLFTLTLADGPVLDTGARREGTAYAVLLVEPPGGLADGETPKRVIAQTDFAADAGQSVGDLTFTTEQGLPLELEGDYRVALQSVFFQAANPLPGAAPLMWACNAQEATDPTGSVNDDPATDEVEQALNPATAPVVMEDVATAFTASNVSVLVLSDVLGQSATDAARAGDELVLGASGMASSTTYGVGFGPAEGPFVQAEQTLTTDEAGNVVAPVSVVVPEAVTPGTGVVTLLDAAGVPAGAPLQLTVLAAPSIQVAESVGDGSISLEVTGAGFDPQAEVVVRSEVDGTETADEAVTLVADGTGAISGTYEVADAEANMVAVRQARADGRDELALQHALENQVPGEVVPPEPAPTSDPVPTTAPQPLPSAPVATTPVAPPVDIPIPDPVPIEEPPLETEATPPELRVSEARLAGETTLGELFGGVSRREVLFLVENVGTSVAPNPLVRLGVGRSTDVEPGLVAAEVGDLEPGARAAVSVNVSLPIASFGTYQVVGQIGDDSAAVFQLRWDTYPWGLMAVNAAGVALLVWGVRRRQQKSVPPVPAGGAEEMGASVVDLTALDKWWTDGKVVRTPAAEEDNDSVVDLDAADRWWGRNQNKVS